MNLKYEKRRLSELVLAADYGTSKSTSVDGNLPILGMKNIAEGQVIAEGCSRANLTTQEFQSLQLEKGDLLFNRTNSFALVGKMGLYDLDGDHAFASYLVRFKIDPTIVSSEYVNLCFQTDSVKRQLHRLKTKGVSQTNINPTILQKEVSISLPTDRQGQDDIIEILNTTIDGIRCLTNLISAKEEEKRGLMQQLLTGKKRFPEFGDEPWQEVRLKKHLVELNERNRAGEIQRVLSVTNKKGFVLPEDHFAHRVASADVSNYKIVREGQFAYNPSRINVGSWAHLSEYDVGILSPMYVVFGVEGDGLLAGYLKHWLVSYEAKERIKRSAQGSVRDSVSFASLCAIKIFLPPTSDEQNRIVQFFNMVDTEIDLLKKLRDAIGEQKRGLMQKLLTGEVRVKVDEKEVA